MASPPAANASISLIRLVNRVTKNVVKNIGRIAIPHVLISLVKKILFFSSVPVRMVKIDCEQKTKKRLLNIITLISSVLVISTA